MGRKTTHGNFRAKRSLGPQWLKPNKNCQHETHAQLHIPLFSLHFRAKRFFWGEMHLFGNSRSADNHVPANLENINCSLSEERSYPCPTCVPYRPRGITSGRLILMPGRDSTCELGWLVLKCFGNILTWPDRRDNCIHIHLLPNWTRIWKIKDAPRRTVGQKRFFSSRFNTHLKQKTKSAEQINGKMRQTRNDQTDEDNVFAKHGTKQRSSKTSPWMTFQWPTAISSNDPL